MFKYIADIGVCINIEQSFVLLLLIGMCLW